MHRRYDSTNIPIELLRTLVTVSELGTLTKAADAQRLTQPAVSAQIRRLQQIVGAELLEKNGSSLRITACGEMVVRYAQRILAMNDQILLQSRMKPDRAATRIGLCSDVAAYALPPLLAALTGTERSQQPVIECLGTQELGQRLANGYVDLAVLPVGGPTAPGLVSSLAAVRWQEPLGWLCARAFLLSPGKPIPLIGSAGSFVQKLAIAALDQSGQLHATAFTATDWSARVAAVRNGFGYLVAPTRLADETIKAAREHFLPALPPFDIGVFVRPDASPHQFARVLDILVEAVRNPIAVSEPVVPPRRRERASAFVMESQKL
ncbi:MAG: LysR family transcriptional regulator [Pseudolabrys sp.]